MGSQSLICMRKGALGLINPFIVTQDGSRQHVIHLTHRSGPTSDTGKLLRTDELKYYCQKMCVCVCACVRVCVRTCVCVCVRVCADGQKRS